MDGRKVLQVVLEQEAYDLIKVLATEADASVSVFIRRVLEAALNLPKFEGRR